MKKLRCFHTCILVALVSAAAWANTVHVVPEKSVIVLPAHVHEQPHVAQSHRTAAEELQKHLALVTGVTIPMVEARAVPVGHYPFHVQHTFDNDRRPLALQESRWRIGPDGAWFYGDAEGYGTGAQFAVYSFLEGQLGIRWTEPGDLGISFVKQKPLRLTTGDFAWTPELMFRTIRSRFRERPIDRTLPQGEQEVLEQWNALARDGRTWQKRMRMGGSRPGGGHAFTTWWTRYGSDHPEYFALTDRGNREPISLAGRSEEESRAFQKICASNPEVARQLVANWVPMRERMQYVTACMNDGTEHFCLCDRCRALDAPRAGEPFAAHLTDRYAHLANAVARRARIHRADAWATMYAYLTTMEPPRRTRLEPNVLVQVVPYVTPLDVDVQEDLFAAWREAGAMALALRPNYHHKYLFGPLPLGIERQMFDVFQVTRRHGVVSVDYDCFKNNWALSGISNYVLAHSFAEPEQPFEYWERQYLQAFGAAAEDVGAYFGYWRDTVWAQRLKPNVVKLAEVGRVGNFTRGLLWSLEDNAFRRLDHFRPEHGDAYYRDADFDVTDGLLQDAMTRRLTAAERYRVSQLVLANARARLVFKAVTTKAPEKYAHALRLQEWLEAHGDELRVEPLGDRWIAATGLAQCAILGGYPLPWLSTPFKWNFKMDPNDVGVAESWHALPRRETESWPAIRVNVYWSNTYESPHIDLKKALKTYDGVGWYAFEMVTPQALRGRRVFLYFEGVDDACTVYVNGVPVGEHDNRTVAGADPAFEIRIDPAIDWKQERQHVMIRVMDAGGPGGVHAPTWVVSRP